MTSASNRPLPLRRRAERFFRSLRTGLLGRFVLVLGAVSLIPLIIVPWLVGLTRESVVDQILTTHSVTARTTAARIDAWIRSLRTSAQTVSANPYLLQASQTEVAEMIAGLLQADPAIKGAMVVNATGLEVGGATRIGAPDFVNPALAAATASPVTVIPGDRVWVRIATPLDEGRGELRLMVDGSELAEILKTEEIGRDAIIGLFDTAGGLIALSNVFNARTEFPKALLDAGRTRATSGAARYDETTPVIAGAHSPVQAAPWFVVSVQPATTAEAVATQMRRTGFLAVAVAIALTALFSGAGYIAIIRPINEIARSQWKAARVREEPRKTQGNEISHLKEAFTALRQQTRDREAIGKLFLSRYHVLDLLGSGGMGSVFRGWDPKLERPVAIKTVHMGGGTHASLDAIEQRHILMREAVTVAKFNHPNLVAIYDVEDGGDAAFLAMEFVDGMSLEALLGQVGTLRVEQVTPMIAQIARGLAAAHSAGVIHCDIKPANILLGRDGSVKVTDFGIARSAVRTTGNLSGTFGTPGYLAPEALTAATYSAAADLFALGAVFFEALTGDTPFAGKDAREILVKTATASAPSVREKDRSVPPLVDGIIASLLEKDPARRSPATATELAEALEEVAQKNDWRWSPPAALASEPRPSMSDLPTAMLPPA